MAGVHCFQACVEDQYGLQYADKRLKVNRISERGDKMIYIEIKRGFNIATSTYARGPLLMVV